jgi:hypothetical protein
MKNQFYTWDDFVNNFGKEMLSAEQVYNRMLKSGLKNFSLCNFDFHFQSDQKQNLERLSDFLKTHYPYKIKSIKKVDSLWELTGITNKIPVTLDTLLYWDLDMAKRGFEFDSQLEGYGAPLDPKNQITPNFMKSKEDYYFDKGIDAYNSGDLSGAIINWTISIEINPNDPNAYYSRAIVKEDWKKALELGAEYAAQKITEYCK